MSAIEKLKKLKETVRVHYVERRPRHYADNIVVLPRDQWDEALKKVPDDYLAIVQEHLKTFVAVEEGTVRAWADRVMSKDTREKRGAELKSAPKGLQEQIETEVRRRYEARKK